ncbi:hypothetical protein FACS1894184_00400 [Clostridia bacterium]|nr:hypothetical protein FACS1894184_00400 [Clostridia bacterium]
MRNTRWAAAKIMMRSVKAAYVTGGVVGLALLATYIIAVAIPGNSTGVVSLGDVGALILVVTAITIPAKCLRRLINLGGKRDDFWYGSVLAYAVMAIVVSLVCLLFNYTVDPLMMRHPQVTEQLSIIMAFGFMQRGAFVAFFQYTAVWFFFAMFVHTLTLLQDCWIGWSCDVIIVTIISVFTPIAALRAFEVWFWRLVIFQPNAFLQILSCLALGLLLFAVNKPILGRKDL